jgi:hypothetical protein
MVVSLTQVTEVTLMPEAEKLGAAASVKPVPTTVTPTFVLPWLTVSGETLVTVGAGSAATVTLSLSTWVVPLVSATVTTASYVPDDE